MDLTPYVDDLQLRLATAAEGAGPDAREAARRLTAPLDAAVRLVLLEALSTAAGEISAELAPGSVDVRLRGGDPEFVVAAPAAVAEPSRVAAVAPLTERPLAGLPPLPNPEAESASATRTTLRLPDHLKAQVEVAAAREGLSVNAWLVRAVAGALDRTTDRTIPSARPDQRGATRLTGWVR